MDYNLLTDFHEAYRGGNYGLPFDVQSFIIEVNGVKVGTIRTNEYIDLVEDGMPEIGVFPWQREKHIIDDYLIDHGFIEEGMTLNHLY